MSRETPSTHPICNGRTTYTSTKLKKIKKDSDRAILYPIVAKEMAVVRKNVEQIVNERQLVGTYVAATIGISKATWCYWLNDPNRNLSVEAMLALSDLIGCTFHELVMGEDAPIKLPKKCSLLYSVIKSRAELHAVCDKILAKTPAEKIPPQKLIYYRLRERANDLNKPLRNYFIETSLEFIPTVREFSSEDPAFKGRLPIFFGFCGFYDDNADFLARQDLSECRMTVGGREVEPIYRKTIGKFAALSEEQQLDILGYLLHERYMK